MQFVDWTRFSARPYLSLFVCHLITTTSITTYLTALDTLHNPCRNRIPRSKHRSPSPHLRQELPRAVNARHRMRTRSSKNEQNPTMTITTARTRTKRAIKRQERVWGGRTARKTRGDNYGTGLFFWFRNVLMFFLVKRLLSEQLRTLRLTLLALLGEFQFPIIYV